MSEITVNIPDGEQKEFAADATVAEAVAELLSNKQRKQTVAVGVGDDLVDLSTRLDSLGLDSLEALIDKTVPAAIRSASPMALAPVRSELSALAAMRDMADKNRVMVSMIGMGYSDTITPGVIVLTTAVTFVRLTASSAKSMESTER